MRALHHPRVATSEGGGFCPVQYWGTLDDGTVFYFRMRSGWANLHIGPPGTPYKDMPLSTPGYDIATAIACQKAGTPYPPLWVGPVAEYRVYDDPFQGYFDSDEDRDRTFAICLEQIEQELK